MPASPAPPPPARLTRRTGLAGLAGLAGLLAATGAGCTTRTDDPARGASPASPSGAPGGPSPVPTADPDVALAATVLTREREMLARVEAVRTAQPRLDRRLRGVREVHAAHVGLLGEATPPEDTPPSAEGAPVRVPRGRRAALLDLARAEDELGAALRQAAFAAESGAFARVLASAAAATAQQALVLREDAEARR